MTTTSRHRHPSGRPRAGEFADHAAPDIERVGGEDAVDALSRQRAAVLALLAPLDDAAVRGLTYALGKWTLEQVVGHLADDERIFAYRALCIARGDPRELPGFDEKTYAAHAASEELPLELLMADYRAVRAASLTLFEGLPADAWLRRGTVNGYEATARGLASHIAGHELRRTEASRHRYLRHGS